MEEPKKRSKLRSRLGNAYYGGLRRLLWLKLSPTFAKERRAECLPYVQFSHATPLLRKLQGDDMALQQNKVTNLKLAAGQLDGVVIRPGEIFSYWYLIGKPSRRKGYREGMILRSGKVCAGVGGGLCQLSNLIYWMALHSPLTVVERHRHGYDVFPDAKRTQPFGSGATCAYPHADLMLTNDTGRTFQLRLRVGEECLEGAWRCDYEPYVHYQVVEREHEIRPEFFGGYSRHNKLYRQTLNPEGEVLCEELMVENHALMMYSPLLSPPEGPIVKKA